MSDFKARMHQIRFSPGRVSVAAVHILNLRLSPQS